MSLALWFLGRTDRALAQAEYGTTLAERPTYVYSRAACWTQRAFLHQLRREVKATRFWAERAGKLATQEGHRYREAVSKVFSGWSVAQLGQVEPGIHQIKDGIAGCHAAGAELDRPYHLALLAEAYLLARNPRQASATLREAIEQAESARSFFYEAELRRLQGQLLWAFSSDRAAASQCFFHALEIAQKQQAKSLELRTAVSMARLLRDLGECDEAAELLEPVYRSFTGTGETSDLCDARLELKTLEKSTVPIKRLAI